MIQYKDPKGVLRPIHANYIEETRYPGGIPFDNGKGKFRTYCKCDRSRDLLCKKYIVGPWLLCNHFIIGTHGICSLSQINEIDLVNATPEEWLPTLFGTLQTELGLEELERRLKNVTI